MDTPINFPPLNVEKLLRKHDIRPSKGLGQNFLVDQSALLNVVKAACISREDVVLEVGAGLGNLTRYLSHAAKHVVAVELDRRLIPIFLDVLSDCQNVDIIEGDILTLIPDELIPKTESDYLVVANIPYYITSAIIRHLLEGTRRPKRMVLTVQEEVANRICAKPGDLSLLALSVQIFGSPKIVAHIHAGAFFPQPKVDSTVVRIDLYNQPAIQGDLIEAFFHIAKAGFSQKRKTLRNSLSAGLRMTKKDVADLLMDAGIDPLRRAQTLSIQEWGKVTKSFEKS